jgi:hypothetical protein
MNPVHSPPPYFLEIHFGIILSSTPGSSERSRPFKFFDQNFVLIFYPSNTGYMPRPSNPSLSDHRIKVLWRAKQTMKSLISSKRTFLQPPGTSSFLGPNEVLCTEPCPRHPQSMFCYNVVAGQVSLPHKTTVKLKCLYSNLYLPKFLPYLHIPWKAPEKSSLLHRTNSDANNFLTKLACFTGVWKNPLNREYANLKQ